MKVSQVVLRDKSCLHYFFFKFHPSTEAEIPLYSTDKQSIPFRTDTRYNDKIHYNI